MTASGEDKLGYYPIGDLNFPGNTSTAEYALSAFKDAGFTDLTLDKFTTASSPNSVFRFITGRYMRP